MHIASAFFIGLLFGLGLIVSGMSNPAKVLGFLDLGGNWDPSLAMVMAGAIAVGLIAFRAAGGKVTSLLGNPMQLPAIGKIDKRLVSGSALFGVGWGLAGICPGPALTLLGTGATKGFVFVAAMLAGIVLFEIFQRRRA
ncbi:MAG: DUF6691 family protein [Rhodocyclaceae bacterium]